MRAIFFLLFVSSALNAADPPATILAIVNGEEIKSNEVERIITNRPKGSAPLTTSLVADLRRTVLDELIDEKLIQQFLAKESIVVTDTELNQQLKVLEESLVKRGSSMDAYRKESGQSDRDMRDRFRSLIGFERFAERTGTLDELKKFHSLNQDYFYGVKVRAQSILIRVPRQATPAERLAARDRSIAIAKSCQVNPASFHPFAKENPFHPGSADLGWLTRFDSLVDDVIAAQAFSMKVNEISAPIELPLGFAILTISERTEPKPRTFESMTDWVKETYAGSLRTVVITRQRQMATIKIINP